MLCGHPHSFFINTYAQCNIDFCYGYDMIFTKHAPLFWCLLNYPTADDKGKVKII